MATNEPRLHIARVNLQPRKGTPSNPDTRKLQRTQNYKDLGPLLQEQKEDSFHSNIAENPQENSPNPPRRQDTPRPSSREFLETLNTSENEPLTRLDTPPRLEREDTPKPPLIRKDETQLSKSLKRRLQQDAAKQSLNEDDIEIPPKTTRRKQLRNALLNLFRRN